MRSLRTLHLRVQRQSESSTTIARWLQQVLCDDLTMPCPRGIPPCHPAHCPATLRTALPSCKLPLKLAPCLPSSCLLRSLKYPNRCYIDCTSPLTGSRRPPRPPARRQATLHLPPVAAIASMPRCRRGAGGIYPPIGPPAATRCHPPPPHPPAHLPTCPPTHLPTCPPAHLPTCPPVPGRPRPPSRGTDDWWLRRLLRH